MSYRKRCKRKNTKSESLHNSLKKLIDNIKVREKKKFTKQTNQNNTQSSFHDTENQDNFNHEMGLELDSFPVQNYISLTQDYAISHYQIQTMEQQYQLNNDYRLQMASLSATKDTNLSYNDPYINPANFLQDPVNFVRDPYTSIRVNNLNKEQDN